MCELQYGGVAEGGVTEWGRGSGGTWQWDEWWYRGMAELGSPLRDHSMPGLRSDETRPLITVHFYCRDDLS